MVGNRLIRTTTDPNGYVTSILQFAPDQPKTRSGFQVASWVVAQSANELIAWVDGPNVFEGPDPLPAWVVVA